jgi:RNA 3'-phosphate cyclase
MQPPGIVTLDGTLGEGGGSVLRLGVGLAACLRREFVVSNIRGNRSNPGLRTQHMMGLLAARDLTGGHLSPVSVGTTEVRFVPDGEWARAASLTIGTAGNIGLLTQTLQNTLVKASPGDYTVRVDGGATYGKWAPGWGYLQNVLFPVFARMGYRAAIEVGRHGFYPKGGARCTVHITPADRYSPLQCPAQGVLSKIGGCVVVEETLRKPRVAERIAARFRSQITSNFPGVPVEVEERYVPALNPGVGADVWAEFDSGAVLGSPTMLGERNLPSEKIGDRLAGDLTRLIRSGATVDDNAADQLLALMAFATGPSEFLVHELTSHATTNLAVLEAFLPDFRYASEPAGNLTRVVVTPPGTE